jgi:NAD(P)-dependent dehydrogenase (short-subunit alcohol dehydrogenase family)
MNVRVSGVLAQMNRSAIVTGGGSGIGRAVALGLARVGWRVALAGRRQTTLDAVCLEGDAQMIGIATDVTNESSVIALFDRSVELFGRIDLLFNNAGKFAPNAAISAVELADFTAVLACERHGHVSLCPRSFPPHGATDATRRPDHKQRLDF